MASIRRPDLNSIRDIIIRNQETGTPNPSSPKQTIVVTREGKIQTADQVPHDQPLSTVPQDTFHDQAARRVDTEGATVRTYMPGNTRQHVTEEGVHGWLYSFTCEFGVHYTMFAYFDGQAYQVLVIEPEVESRFRSAHTGHIFPNGNICFGVEFRSGRPTLRDAYAKSVVWANGLSYMIRSGDETFPFSINNL